MQSHFTTKVGNGSESKRKAEKASPPQQRMASRDNMAAVYQAPTALGTELVLHIRHLTEFSQRQIYYLLFGCIYSDYLHYRNLGLKIVKSLSRRPRRRRGRIQTQTCDYSTGAVAPGGRAISSFLVQPQISIPGA